jgi:hypothetical protein
VETAVGELHLRFDAGGPRHAPSSKLSRKVGKQRTLADARVAADDDDATCARERVGEELIESLAFGVAAQQV